MKRGPYKGTGKAWANCLAKLEAFRTTEITYWSEYQLLGYWCDMTKMPFDDDQAHEPRKHPQLVQMRYLIKRICRPEWVSRGANDLPKEYEQTQVKRFLDWAWTEMQKVDLPCHSLALLSGEKATWVERWYKHKTSYDAVFDPSLLDLGD